MITPRTTRLVRVPDLQTFRRTVADLACEGTPFDTRDRLVLVPTHAAAAHLVRGIEQRMLAPDDALVLPDFITRSELRPRLAGRLANPPASLTDVEREVVMAVACHAAVEEGAEPPFRLRPGLIAEIVRFYDTIQLNLKDAAAFERLALGMLEPGAVEDRGAERLVLQTRFLARAFRRFEEMRAGTGSVDEHLLRDRLMAEAAVRPWRHVVIAVSDRASDSHGLFPSDWDLLTRIPGLERLDVVATDASLAGAMYQRIHQLLPGAEEVRIGASEPSPAPVLLTAPDGARVHTARDREEEVAGFARWVRKVGHPLDRFALVVRRPLPYVYVAREVLASAGVPSQMFDALPLAAEPYAAALDLVLDVVAANFRRQPAVALLRSPHFRFGQELAGRDVAALDRALADSGFQGGVEMLERVLVRWAEAARLPPAPRRAGGLLLEIARELAPLGTAAPCAEHVDRLLAFLKRHERPVLPDDSLRPRLLRGRAAILEVLTDVRDAHTRFDAAPIDFSRVLQTVRRWIESKTFAPYTGEGGAHVVDADSARFGDYDRVQLAGLVEGEWPEAPTRNIFYPPALLKDLGWPSDADRLEAVRAAFHDLLRLPSRGVIVSAFVLEDDAMVGVSPLVEMLESSAMETAPHVVPARRTFEFEALGLDPVETGHLSDTARPAARRRVDALAGGRQPPGRTSGHPLRAYSLSAVERYQDCPFRFFAADVLRLEEPVEDEPTLNPRAHGQFLHEVFQRFFEAWDARGAGTITVQRIDEARALFEEAAAPLLDRLSDADAALERARLFGSAVAPGIVDVVLGLEASRPVEVGERWLEYRLEGEFSLGEPHGRRLALKGVADRIDLLEGDRIRVIDYKSGYPPNPKRALQAAVYALCAQERLQARDGRPWVVDEAAYVAFSGKRTLVPVVRTAAAAGAILTAARERLFGIVDGIERGEFPVKPYELRICGYCPYPSVCRKDYVVGD